MTIPREALIELKRKAGRARAKAFTPEFQAAAGKSRAKAFTSDYQRAAVSHRTVESLRESGRKGFAALVRKHGFDGALEHLAEYRRKHPTKLERAVAAWLDAREIPYQREARVAGIYVDFLIGPTVVFVDGQPWHTNGAVDDRDYEGRDAMHDMTLAANRYRVIRLAEAAIDDGRAFERLEIELFAPPATCLVSEMSQEELEAAIAAEVYTPVRAIARSK